jgi:hypothetical protein
MISDQVSKFLESLNNNDSNSLQHVILFYEEPEFARDIQSRFLEIGLARDEQCVIASCYDAESLRQVFGINIEEYRAEDLLRVHQLRCDARGIQREYFSDLAELLIPKTKSQGSYRSVRSMVSHATILDEEKYIESVSNMEMECMSYYSDSTNEMRLCCYPIADIDATLDRPWMKTLLKSHQGVIYMPRLSNGVALNISK